MGTPLLGTMLYYVPAIILFLFIFWGVLKKGH